MDCERDKVEECGEDYWIVCPKCEHEVEIKNICEMPWGVDDVDDYTCPKCGKTFEVKPRYKFEGFYVYTDWYDDDFDD